MDKEIIIMKTKKIRRTKQQILEDKLQELKNVQAYNNVTNIIRKRGRKPKGGKIVHKDVIHCQSIVESPSIIMHLKCSLKDLDITNDNNIQSFNFSENNVFEKVKTGESQSFSKDQSIIEETKTTNEEVRTDDHKKQIWKKLKQLENSLQINSLNNSKSDCFWCTCSFDNPSVYIPTVYQKETYLVYGSFCSPECATAFLMKESIDSSTKFERYQLLNYIYSKVYNYKCNIKPAPNPYYMLNKFYGNLTIQEFRSLLNNDRLYLIIDKPITRTLPELHDDNEDFIINNKTIPYSNYKIKTQKTVLNKKNILKEQFKS